MTRRSATVPGEGTLRRAAFDYLGTPTLLEGAMTVEVVADPQVPNCYGIRVTDRARGEHMDFLATGVPVQRVTAEDLAEVEFETWPPRSGALKFFV